MIPLYNSSHSITNSTPNVLKADNNPAYAYAFPSNNQQTTNTGGWLSGLRSKISLFTGISDWMNQLGIGDNKQSNNNVNLGYSTSSNTSTDSSPMEDTLIYPSVSLLDDQPSSSDPLTNPWDFGASFLADLDSSHNWDDTLEKQHFGPLNDLITLGGKGHGHSFQCVSLIHPTWCDKCGDFIWGILRQAIKCQNCNLTCHERCRNLITLDCRSADSTISSSQIFSLYPQLNDGTLGTIPKDIQLPSMPNSPEKKQINGISVVNPLFSPSKISSTLPRSFAPLYDDSTLKTHTVKTSEGQTIQIEEIYVKEDTPFEWTPHYIQNDLEEKIKIFNQSADSIMNMTLNADGITFHGNIQVRMNFTRPISIVSGEQIPTHYDIMSNETSKTMNKMTITSFFLPRNTVKTININSEMTSRQMIVTLLRKFRVADNARKFALYECNQEEDEGTSTLLRRMKRIGDEICPLRVVLNWDFNTTNTLVLQENDTGDIIWDAFEVPELNNFIRILGLEEQQYQYQIRQKYNQYRYQLHEELRRRGHDVEADDDPLPSPPSPHKQKTMNEYGTSDSMIVSDVFTTMKESSNPSEYSNDPMYVNIDFLKNNKMDESTKL